MPVSQSPMSYTWIEIAAIYLESPLPMCCSIPGCWIFSILWGVFLQASQQNTILSMVHSAQGFPAQSSSGMRLTLGNSEKQKENSLKSLQRNKFQPTSQLRSWPNTARNHWMQCGTSQIPLACASSMLTAWDIFGRSSKSTFLASQMYQDWSCTQRWGQHEKGYEVTVWLPLKHSKQLS